MGQEASLPQNGDDVDFNLEEQAKAPPSAVNPPPTPTTRTGSRKLMNAVFRTHATQQEFASTPIYLQGDAVMNGGGEHHHHHHNHNNHDLPTGGHHHAMNLSQQEQNYVDQITRQEDQLMYQQQQQQQQSSSKPFGNFMHEKPKKGLVGKVASVRGAALINSMRNLSLGGALRSKKGGAVNDWEKQWDADEDDDSEGEDEGEAAVTNGQDAMAEQLHFQQQQLQLLQQQQLQQQQFESKQSPVAAALQDQDDGLEWDTAADMAQQEGRPNIVMFMPMLRVLGKGSFGKVVLVQKRVGKERGQLFAMKILKKSHLVKRRQIERTRTERKVLSLVNHPFIMKLHYAFQSEDKLYLVLDYCPGGELFFHLSRFRRFPERVARFYSAELLLAIGHLHKRGIIYRDLKPENVLLDAEGHVKLGDFGLAKAGIVHPLEGAMSMCGTPEYMAPEILAQQGHGFCVDYWGLGMIVYEMMTGLPPWYTTDRAKLFRKLKSAPLDIPSYFSAPAANCVSALLERDPRRRLGVAGIRSAMEHEFFRNVSWRSLYARRVEAPIQPCEGWKPPEAVKDVDPVDCDGDTTTDFTVIERMNSKDLEVATQNFDNQFTRMPVESEDVHEEHPNAGAEEEQLHSETFLGFSFDGTEKTDPYLNTTTTGTATAAASQPPSPNRPISHLAQSHALD